LSIEQTVRLIAWGKRGDIALAEAAEHRLPQSSSQKLLEVGSASAWAFLGIGNHDKEAQHEPLALVVFFTF